MHGDLKSLIIGREMGWFTMETGWNEPWSFYFSLEILMTADTESQQLNFQKSPNQLAAAAAKRKIESIHEWKMEKNIILPVLDSKRCDLYWADSVMSFSFTNKTPLCCWVTVANQMWISLTIGSAVIVAKICLWCHPDEWQKIRSDQKYRKNRKINTNGRKTRGNS